MDRGTAGGSPLIARNGIGTGLELGGDADDGTAGGHGLDEGRVIEGSEDAFRGGGELTDAGEGGEDLAEFLLAGGGRGDVGGHAGLEAFGIDGGDVTDHAEAVTGIAGTQFDEGNRVVGGDDITRVGGDFDDPPGERGADVAMETEAFGGGGEVALEEIDLIEEVGAFAMALVGGLGLADFERGAAIVELKQGQFLVGQFLAAAEEGLGGEEALLMEFRFVLEPVAEGFNPFLVVGAGLVEEAELFGAMGRLEFPFAAVEFLELGEILLQGIEAGLEGLAVGGEIGLVDLGDQVPLLDAGPLRDGNVADGATGNCGEAANTALADEDAMAGDGFVDGAEEGPKDDGEQEESGGGEGDPAPRGSDPDHGFQIFRGSHIIEGLFAEEPVVHQSFASRL